jgi:hypothetical protein
MMRRFATAGLSVLTAGVAACYEHAPRRGPLAVVADSLLPRSAVAGCRPSELELPGDPRVHACTGGETALLIDRWGRVRRIIRHERPTRGSVLALYLARAGELTTVMGSGQPVCFGEDGRWPEGRQWQGAEFFTYVTPAVDTTEVELVWALGRPRFGHTCIRA